VAARLRFALDNSVGFLTLVFFTLASSQLFAQDPPQDLVRRVAQQEARNSEERSHYAYRQEVQLEDFPGRGQSGNYRETRDVFFSPEGERTERAVGEPQSHLARLVLTPELKGDLAVAVERTNPSYGPDGVVMDGVAPYL